MKGERWEGGVEVATERYAREDVVVAGVSFRRGGMVLGLIDSGTSCRADGLRRYAPPSLLRSVRYSRVWLATTGERRRRPIRLGKAIIPFITSAKFHTS